MIVNISQVKARLSEYLEALSRGERILICNRNRPVAELRPVASPRTTPRPIGGAKDTFAMPSSFFEPLPEDLLDAFTGAAGSSPPAPSSRAAERKPDARKQTTERRKARQ